MTRDDKVFVMGEEVARYNGAYKVCRTDLNDHMARKSSFGDKIDHLPMTFSVRCKTVH